MLVVLKILGFLPTMQLLTYVIGANTTLKPLIIHKFKGDCFLSCTTTRILIVLYYVYVPPRSTLHTKANAIPQEHDSYVYFVRHMRPSV